MSANGTLKFIAISFVVAVHLAASGARAGELTLAGCIANGGTNGCTAAANDSLAGAIGVAVSPDGQDVYVASFSGDSVTHFRRATNGDLTFVGCFANAGAHDCTNPPMQSLDRATGIAVSPDGRSVYVTAAEGVTQFTRAADGTLTFTECILNLAQHGCLTPGLNALDGAFGVAVSPSGDFVYVVADFGESLSYFNRGTEGELALSACVANGGMNGCTDLPIDSLEHAVGVAVSPDGASIYVASSGGDAITSFLGTSSSCIANAGLNGCTDPLMDVLDGATGIVVSPDGESVYVASWGSHSVSHLTRALDGTLTFTGCVANQGANGCADPPMDALGQAVDVAISPDGQRVYVASEVGDSVSYLIRAANGSLTFGGCVADGGANGCDDPAMDALNGVDGIAVSPDGQSIYAVSFEANSIAHFTRSAPTTTTTLPAGACSPTSCDDGDACTTDACVGGACVRTDVTGFASARCACEQAVGPACAGQEIPDAIDALVAKACDLLLDAEGTDRAPKKRKLLKKAAARWERADTLRRKRRTQRVLPPACLMELQDHLLDARDRTTRLRDTL